MKDLKACPFCGSKAMTYVDYDQCGGGELLMSAYVQCSDCGIYKRVKFDASNKQFSDFTNAFDRVINLWNQRV